jgi:hypothetical protein
LNEVFSTKYQLGRDLCVDESMVGFKGQWVHYQNLIYFWRSYNINKLGELWNYYETNVWFFFFSHAMVQYLRFKKAHQWGPKFWVLAESDTGYVSQIQPYKGKRFDPIMQHPQGLSYAVVHSLVSRYFGKGHHVTTDRYRQYDFVDYKVW